MKLSHVIIGKPELADFVTEITSNGSEDTVVIDLSGLMGSTSPSFYDVVKVQAFRITSLVRWINGRGYAKELFDEAGEAYLDWIAERPDVPVARGKSLKEWFTYRGEISLWWFTALSQKEPSKSPMVRYVHQIHILKRILGELSPGRACFETSHWVLWVDSMDEYSLFRQLIAQHLGPSPIKISFEARCGCESSGFARTSFALRRLKAWAPAVYRGIAAIRSTVRMFIYVVAQLWLLKRIANTVNDDDECPEPPSATQNVRAVFITEFPRDWQYLQGHERYDDKVRREDRYFKSAPFYLHERGIDVRWWPNFLYRHGIDGMSLSILKGQFSEWKLWLKDQPLPDIWGVSSPGWDVVLRLFAHSVWWWLLYGWLIVVKKVHHQWKYAGLPVGWLVRQDLYCLCANRGIYYGFWMECHREAMHSFQPDVVFYRKEFYSHARAIAAVAPPETRTFGVQHGAMLDTEYHYRMRSCEIGSQQFKGDYIHYAPIPDRIIAFGNHTREFMSQKGGYPADRIEPLGSLRHDTMAARYSPDVSHDSLRSDHQRDSIRRDLELPERAQIVLICLGAEGCDVWFETVVKGIRYAGLSAFVVVKLHPSSAAAGKAEYAHQTAETLRFRDYIVAEGPIAEWICASDVVVTQASTTGLEAVLLGKPLIIVTSEEQYAVYPFVEERVALPAANSIEMGKVLEFLWSDHFDSEKWAQVRKKFLARHLNNADANARERLYQLVISESRPRANIGTQGL